MKIYTFAEAIDLGYQTIAVFSAQEKAEAYRSVHKAEHLKKYKYELDDAYITIEEFEVDELA